MIKLTWSLNKSLAISCVLYLSVMRIAALGGLIEELQQGRPAVWCLMFDHHCTQLGQRVLHCVSATQKYVGLVQN